MADVRRKRVYEEATAADGYRVLVDRLWPRGVSKDRAHVDLWLKEVGPSSELRKWFGHDPAKYDEFARRYRKELSSSDAYAELAGAADEHATITLVYGAKDEEHNQARVLQELLQER